MRYRVLPSGKGLVLILLLPWSFLGGQALGQPLLNLVGYLLAVVLAFSLILGILSLAGIRIEAVSARVDGVTLGWARLTARGARGPFGLSWRQGRARSPERLVRAPEPSGWRDTLPAEFAEKRGDRLWARLRAFPLGLWSLTIEAPVSGIDAGSETPTPAPAAADQPGEPYGGLREHRSGEGVRDVHWAASAHRQQLMVRIRPPVEEERPVPRRIHRPAPFDPPERRALLHAATGMAALAAIAFLAQLGALPLWPAIGTFLLMVVGTRVSLRRAGPPPWPLLVGLYAGIFATLGWFLFTSRQPGALIPAMAILLAMVSSLFAWDLRSRQYLRAQQLIALLMVAVFPAFQKGMDTPGLGLALLVSAIALILAAWAESRHALGAREVPVRELLALPPAWIPLAVIGLGMALLHPLLPAVPLPPLPTFGFRAGTEAPRESANLPGEPGTIRLNARWITEPDPVLRVASPRVTRMRAEVFERYGWGQWWPSESARWVGLAGSRATGHLLVTLLRPGMRILPVPETAVGVGTLPRSVGLGTAWVATLSPPSRAGDTFVLEAASPPDPLTDRPTAFERDAGTVPLRVRAIARSWAQGQPTARKALVALIERMRHDTRYDLAAPAAPPGQDPTVYFLTESHRGFCVHYATSLALMGRTLGVPTRLVTGYAGGVRRAGGTEFRASDAHAWVEAFVDGHWEPFDPTPPAAPPAFPWERGAIAVLGGLGGLAVWRFRRRRHPATLEFDRLARRLRRMGVPVSPAMTTREIVSLLAERGLELKAAEVADRFRAYEEARFAAPTRSAM